MKSKKRIKYAKVELEKAEPHAIIAARLLRKTKYASTGIHERVKNDADCLRSDGESI